MMLAEATAPTVYHTPPTAPVLAEIAILTLLVTCAIAMIRMRHLFGVAMLSGIYSLLSAAFFVALDAVDVAFTEAAVGAGISTVLVLSGIAMTSKREKRVTQRRPWLPVLVTGITGAALIYATVDMPAYGDPNSPANAYVGREYVVQTPADVEVPNIVTAVLASYRGFDTLGETVVVFTAGLACILLLGSAAIRGGGGDGRSRDEEES
ncbi:MAG: DUF4040 domain-containing protein [Pseudomonadota bacterium]